MKTKTYKNSSKLLCMLLSTFLNACGKPTLTEHSLLISPQTTLIPSLRAARDCINSAAGADVVIVTSNEPDSIKMIHFTDGDPQTCGRWIEEENVIHVDPEQGRCPPGLVEIHEIGHALGLQHNYTDPTDIMYPTLAALNMAEACRSLISHFEVVPKNAY